MSERERAREALYKSEKNRTHMFVETKQNGWRACKWGDSFGARVLHTHTHAHTHTHMLHTHTHTHTHDKGTARVAGTARVRLCLCLSVSVSIFFSVFSLSLEVLARLT